MDRILEKRIFAEKNDGGLDALCRDLVSYQLQSWPALKHAYEQLKSTKKRVINCNGFFVIIQHNPRRVKNIMADGVNHFSIESCFLCHKNLPSEQMGILWKEYIILTNPSPIFPNHMTISSIDHRPQRIERDIKTIFWLSLEFGPNWLIIYNGHNCGASNPHHMHFQAILRGSLPVEEEIKHKERVYVIFHNNLSLFKLKDMGREVLCLKGKDLVELERVFINLLFQLKTLTNIDDEPMVNLISFFENDEFFLIIFPRSRHRPNIFYRKEDPVYVSPAVIEMAGTIITANKRDFERLNDIIIEKIYNDVSLEVPLEGLAESLECIELFPVS
ncbi:MAG: DUF4922 domain-containing protein [Syntrophorhabdaceae bacterium]|nr:DUF4922 domain-containing protein [Syntrophorhabdaceae bacterium]